MAFSFVCVRLLNDSQYIFSLRQVGNPPMKDYYVKFEYRHIVESIIYHPLPKTNIESTGI